MALLVLLALIILRKFNLTQAVCFHPLVAKTSGDLEPVDSSEDPTQHEFLFLDVDTHFVVPDT